VGEPVPRRKPQRETGVLTWLTRKRLSDLIRLGKARIKKKPEHKLRPLIEIDEVR